MPLDYQLQEEKDSSTTYGVLAIVFCFIPLLAWIFGYTGLKKSKKANNEKARILSIIGIFLGFLGFIFNIYLYNKGILTF